MKAEPLKGKIRRLPDRIQPELVYHSAFYPEDVKSAVEWLKYWITQMPSKFFSKFPEKLKRYKKLMKDVKSKGKLVQMYWSDLDYALKEDNPTDGYRDFVINEAFADVVNRKERK